MLKPEMEMMQDKPHYTFFQSNSTSITPDLMLTDIYEVFIYHIVLETAFQGY